MSDSSNRSLPDLTAHSAACSQAADRLSADTSTEPEGGPSRREFLLATSASAAVAGVTIVAAGGLTGGNGSTNASQPAASGTPAANAANGFTSAWPMRHDGYWLGPEYWPNPLQDWSIARGRLTTVRPALGRSVHLLTHDLADSPSTLSMTVRMARKTGAAWSSEKGSAGFRVGVQGPLKEYRNNAVHGKGIDAGLASDGRLFLGEGKEATVKSLDLGKLTEIELRLIAEPGVNSAHHTLVLTAHDPQTKQNLGEVRREGVPASALAGNVALVANFGAPQAAGGGANKKKKAAAETGPGYGVGEFAFSAWTVSGSKVAAHPERAFGPILFTQYTLSDRVLKLTAQFPPVAAKDAQEARLDIQPTPRSAWKQVATAPIHPQARTVSFRLTDWEAARDVPYRVVYTERFTDGTTRVANFTGTFRAEPITQETLSVADVSCNAHYVFPNPDYVRKMEQLNPDMLAFTGDQFYESTGGFGVVRTPKGSGPEVLEQAILDVLRKWYIHGWTWQSLTRNRPSIAIPDDHDVYQGNIWGEAGAAQTTTQEAGGYNMHPDWVNVVHRIETSHHPDPYDAMPGKQGITKYFGALTYGGVSFAILADRQFKSAPEGKVPATGGRADHVTDVNFDPKTADLPGLELLGPSQMKFLEAWVTDWKNASMKAVVSQTIFTAMATHHGGGHQYLRADYDTNGWPQTARNAALRIIRKAFAVHLAGDQHLGAVVHYGVDGHRDAGLGFAGPAVNNLYPRWWEPTAAEGGAAKAPAGGESAKSAEPERSGPRGDFRDSFGHPLTVVAVANPLQKFRGEPVAAEEDKAAGIGLVRFHKPTRSITIDCWPYSADVSRADTQFPGWPVKSTVAEQYARKPVAHLPTLDIKNVPEPVVSVFDAKGELLYTLRLSGGKFRPWTFADGEHTVRLGDPEGDKWKSITLRSVPAGDTTVIRVEL